MLFLFTLHQHPHINITIQYTQVLHCLSFYSKIRTKNLTIIYKLLSCEKASFFSTHTVLYNALLQ